MDDGGANSGGMDRATSLSLHGRAPPSRASSLLPAFSPFDPASPFSSLSRCVLPVYELQCTFLFKHCPIVLRVRDLNYPFVLFLETIIVHIVLLILQTVMLLFIFHIYFFFCTNVNDLIKNI